MYNSKLISRLLPKAEEQRIKFNGIGDVRRVWRQRSSHIQNQNDDVVFECSTHELAFNGN